MNANAPLCPLLLQARASIPLIQCREDAEKWTNGFTDATPVTNGPLYPLPSAAPGVACLGSACAWWEPRSADLTPGVSNPGVCSKARGATPWSDPAVGGDQ